MKKALPLIGLTLAIIAAFILSVFFYYRNRPRFASINFTRKELMIYYKGKAIILPYKENEKTKIPTTDFYFTVNSNNAVIEDAIGKKFDTIKF